MATKKQLVNRWLEEPGRSIALRIREILVEHAEIERRLQWKAFEESGNFHIPDEWLTPFDTRTIFDLLIDLPYRSEIENGRDLRGVPSIGGGKGWDFSDADFSNLPGNEGYTFMESILDRAIFDGSKGYFDFRGCDLRKVRFRTVRFLAGNYTSVYFEGDCIECDFTKARMKMAQFMEQADLRGSSFVEADLRRSVLCKCDLRECNFRGANLTGALIIGSVIDKTTDFRSANLSDVAWRDWRSSFLGKLLNRGCNWRHGTYDSTTIHD